MELEKLQTAFLKNVLHPTSHDDITYINSDKRLSANDRIEIYSIGYRLRLIEALMDNFPAIHTLLGDEDFEQLALEYITEFPSTHFSLRYMGEKMVQFTKKHRIYRESPFISEMANFEWKLRQAFDAKDITPLSRETLSKIPPNDWPELCFALHPSFSLITLEWNTPALWKAIIQDEPPRPPKKLDKSQPWIIWRPKLETHFRSVDLLESGILNEISQNKTFTSICEFADMEIGEGAEHIVIEYLNQWITDGLLS